MYYSLPNDIRNLVTSTSTLSLEDKNNILPMDYPFDKPERWRRFYKSHIRCYRKRGFWNKVTWDIAHTVLAYVYAALTLDNPTATGSDGELLLTLIRKDDDDYDYKENIERKRYLFKSIPEVLSIGRREDLKRLLCLCLKWYKKAPIRLDYHHYKDKPQSYWLDRLIECTRYEDDTPLWTLWSEVFEMFWW